MADKLIASEALYGFVTWMWKRRKPLPDKGSIMWAALIDRYCKENDLASPRDEWVRERMDSMRESIHQEATYWPS